MSNILTQSHIFKIIKLIVRLNAVNMIDSIAFWTRANKSEANKGVYRKGFVLGLFTDTYQKIAVPISGGLSDNARFKIGVGGVLIAKGKAKRSYSAKIASLKTPFIGRYIFPYLTRIHYICSIHFNSRFIVLARPGHVIQAHGRAVYFRLLNILKISELAKINRLALAVFCVGFSLTCWSQTGPTSVREQEINRQLRDYGRVLLRNDSLEGRDAYYKAFGGAIRDSLSVRDKNPFGRLKRAKKRVEKVLNILQPTNP